MSPGYFWTGIGLMSAGGLYMVTGAAVSSDSTFEDGVGTSVLVFGAALAGSGVAVYLLGKRKARAAGNPQVVALRRGVLVRSQFSF